MKKEMNKKGAASIVATILLIAMTVVIVGLVWTIVSNLVNKNIESSESCFGIFEKVVLNSEYTCYTDGGFRFSIDVGDIDVKEVLVGISANGSSSSFKISKNSSEINNLIMYPSNSSTIVLPSKNEGLTYVFNMSGAGLSVTPDSISIAPVIKGTQCDISDSMNNIIRCS